jgi:hypothetical protein
VPWPSTSTIIKPRGLMNMRPSLLPVATPDATEHSGSLPLIEHALNYGQTRRR